MNKYGSKGRTSSQSVILLFSQFVTQVDAVICMGSVLSICLYSWKLNRRKAAVIFVHLLEWNTVFIQIPFGSSLISNIFSFYKAKVPLKVDRHGILSII